MSMVNKKTKPIPIKNKPTSLTTTKSSSTSSPFSSPPSSSNASPEQTSSSSNVSPATTIQTLVLGPSNANDTLSAVTSSSIVATSTNAYSVTTSKSVGNFPDETASRANGATCLPSSAPQSARSSGGNGVVFKLEPFNGAPANSNQHYISSDILDDLASRFIINVPDDERNNLIRICFQIELAHWFYLDFFCANDEKKCGMKQFATSLFQHIPFLKVHLATIDKILESWKQYKLTVPTYGAILLSEDLTHVLLVQSYWAKSSWGFPKGKVNENEDPIHCATREVFEETGYDITHLIIQSDYIESIINDQYTRLYLVRNVPFKTQFMPRTRKEIKCCEWFSIDMLPTNKNDANTKQNLGINPNSFFMIMPFIKRLKKWVNDKRTGNGNGDGNGTGTQHHNNKLKFNGQLSNSIYNFNNALMTNKKTDTKLPFKSTPTGQSASVNQNSNGSSHIYQVTMNQNCITNNNKLSGNKRQRHKSMGDIDGMMKSNNTQVLNGFYNNLRFDFNNAGKQYPVSNIFNDLTSANLVFGNNCESNEQQREKHSKQSVRRQKSTGGNFTKVSELSGNSVFIESTSLTTTTISSVGGTSSNGNNNDSKPSSVSTITLKSYHDGFVKESNIDMGVQLQQPKSPKCNNVINGIYYTFSNKNSGNHNLSLKETAANNGEPGSDNNSVHQKQQNKQLRTNNVKKETVIPSTSISATTSTTTPKIIRTRTRKSNLTSMTGASRAALNSSSSPPVTKSSGVLKPSPNFNAWKDFSFTKNCIANVFC